MGGRRVRIESGRRKSGKAGSLQGTAVVRSVS